MNVIFLTIGTFNNIEDPGIYSDLLRCFRNFGHDVYIVSSLERRKKKNTSFTAEEGVHFLRVKVGNITKCRIIEKGISTILIGNQYKKAINLLHYYKCYYLLRPNLSPIKDQLSLLQRPTIIY